jgi:hypothetical protein
VVRKFLAKLREVQSQKLKEVIKLRILGTSFIPLRTLTLKIAQFRGDFLTTNPATAGPIDANRSIQFVFIRGFFLILLGYGYAALRSSA